MATHATVTSPPSYRIEPHRWQTQIWARILRRGGRYWVITRHVRRHARPLAVGGRARLRGVSGPVIVIANHSSHFDTPVVLSALPERIRARTAVAAAADKFYRQSKRTWWYSLFFNAFPIERAGGRSALDYSLKLLRDGWSILLYPEGTRSTTGEVQRFRHGVSILAMQAGVPVVPIYMDGLRRVMPKGERRPRPAAVSVRIGDPVRLTGIESVPAGTEMLERSLAALSLQPLAGDAERRHGESSAVDVRAHGMPV